MYDLKKKTSPFILSISLSHSLHLLLLRRTLSPFLAAHRVLIFLHTGILRFDISFSFALCGGEADTLDYVLNVA